MNMNECNIVGRLSRDPILKSYTKADGTAGHRCFMTVAVTRIADLGKARAEQRTNFIPVVVWGDQAKRCAQFLAKGTEVGVSGEFIAESTPKLDAAGNQLVIDGVKQYNDYRQLQANRVQFGQASPKNAAAGTTNAATAATLQAMQEQIDRLAAGHGVAPTTDVPADTTAETTGTVGAGASNPFDQTAEGASAIV
jgi:single-stranded DNA-binding protein